MISTATPKERYQEYLRSGHWLKLRAAKLEEAFHICQKCYRDEDLQVHHLIYRHPWESAVLSDLKVLCKSCHRRAHGLYVPDPKRKTPRIKRHHKKPVRSHKWRSRASRAPGKSSMVYALTKKERKAMHKYSRAMGVKW